ncbi:HAD-IIIA family hydrolase [Ruminiclostridium herbifermentans]|uniref:HAD-IIIA family hydrolase n=1 Tax=Ruminiclostridium herbifermentans TaxID=2488810 RepID=A0A4U7JLJ5_9FIRM|nr:HAD-IIIA family hydrolase [Ruminiclostridium herbifermentans]QNU68227.1 HAD-IIIA family hydrolase [Ruminiclostridium herbifermentans]
MKAVILAGGLGTRLREFTKEEVPKPMVKINEEPILQHQIKKLKKYGITEIIFIIGYLGSKIKEYFGDGRKFGVTIQYFEETEPLGTAGALYYIRNLLHNQFLVVFGDIIFDMDLDRFIRFHNENEADCSIVIHPNNHPYDSDVIALDKNNRVINILEKNQTRDFYYNNCVIAGMFLLNISVIEYIKEGVKQDLVKNVISNILPDKKVLGYRTTEYLKDMGTPDRYLLVQKHMVEGIVAQRNLSNRQKAVFIDRDGTINKYCGLVSKPEELEVFEEAYTALKLLNNSEYLSIVITNQPVVARNLCTIDELDNIHKKLEYDLGLRGVYIDDLYYCPHHPDKGYPEENKLYKIECDCRKPKIGLIQSAVEKYNIDLSSSFMIGDSTIDIQTGKNAGLKTILLGSGVIENDAKYKAKPDYYSANILEAVKIIINK